MSHPPMQKLLFNLVSFLKKTTFHHKKKLIVLVVIALLSYIGKKKLHFIHLLQLAQTITKVLSYLPLPTIPTYRKVNNFQPVYLHPLAKQILATMNVQQIRQQIKLKTSTWDHLKSSIFSGTILSLILFNVQSLYFIIQNKYSADFQALGSLEAFQQVMGEMRKCWVKEIPVIKQIVEDLLFTQIKQIDVKEQYSLDQYVDMVENMVEKIFGKKYNQVNEPNEHVDRNINRKQLPYSIAKNYFTSPYQYIPQNSSKVISIFSTVTSLITKPLSLLSHLIPSPQCSLTPERFEWSRVGYQIPLKKYVLPDNLAFNKEAQELIKLVKSQITQILGSVNFSTLLYEFAKFNRTVLKNRLFLYFSKTGKEKLRCAQALSVLYKLVKEEVLVVPAYEKNPNLKPELEPQTDNKRERFYQGEILKAIKLKQTIQNSQPQHNQRLLLIQQQHNQKQPKRQPLTQPAAQNPEIYLTNLHLQQIYQSKQLSHLTSQFYLKYFNQRSGVVIPPRPSDPSSGQRPGSEEDQMKKLLNMLGANEPLNEKEN